MPQTRHPVLDDRGDLEHIFCLPRVESRSNISRMATITRPSHTLRDFWEDPWQTLVGTSRLFDQAFGDILEAEDFMPPRLWRGLTITPRLPRPPQTSGVSEVVNTDQEFRVGLDTRQFKPEEIDIKVKDNRLVVHAKHEERPDEYGYIMREFTRQYVLPKTSAADEAPEKQQLKFVLLVSSQTLVLLFPHQQHLICHQQIPLYWSPTNTTILVNNKYHYIGQQQIPLYWSPRSDLYAT